MAILTVIILSTDDIFLLLIINGDELWVLVSDYEKNSQWHKAIQGRQKYSLILTVCSSSSELKRLSRSLMETARSESCMRLVEAARLLAAARWASEQERKRKSLTWSCSPALSSVTTAWAWDHIRTSPFPHQANTFNLYGQQYTKPAQAVNRETISNKINGLRVWEGSWESHWSVTGHSLPSDRAALPSSPCKRAK